MKISLHHQVAEREKEETLSQYKGTGYVSTRGFINLIFDETAPLHLSCSLKKSIHIYLSLFWLINIIQKERTELFDEHANKAVMNELSESDGLETYELQIIEDLVYKDKNRYLSCSY